MKESGLLFLRNFEVSPIRFLGSLGNSYPEKKLQHLLCENTAIVEIHPKIKVPSLDSQLVERRHFQSNVI